MGRQIISKIFDPLDITGSRKARRKSKRLEAGIAAERKRAETETLKAEDERIRRLKLIQTPGAAVSTGEITTGRKQFLGQ
jgi:hypothetical protein